MALCYREYHRMALPSTIPVKISSEAGGYVSITPVVARAMPLRELVEMLLPVTGKDTVRIREILRRGSLVHSASRLRWEGWDAAPEDIQALLQSFPDHAPGRPFTVEACLRVMLHCSRGQIEIERAVGARKRILRPRSFWEVLMALALEQPPRYREYDYASRADRFSLSLAPPAASYLHDHAHLLHNRAQRQAVEGNVIRRIEFYLARDPG